MVIETVLTVAKSLFGFVTALRAARRDRRDRIADYFEGISKALAEVSARLRNWEVPRGKCAELGVYAVQLPSTIGEEVGQAQAKELAARLQTAHNVEGLLAELANAPDREAMLAKLDEASGAFMALAMSVRAAPEESRFSPVRPELDPAALGEGTP